MDHSSPSVWPPNTVPPTRRTRQAPPDAGAAVRAEDRRRSTTSPANIASLQFRGLPTRSYSPTYPLEGRSHDRLLHFHVRVLSGGMVSPALGHNIRAGHRVKLTGPYGSAFFREGHPGRIVLVASGTGFRPDVVGGGRCDHGTAATRTGFHRGARNIRALYMHAALVPAGAVSERHHQFPWCRNRKRFTRRSQGQADRAFATTVSDDVVYTAGAPAMTDSVHDGKGRGRPLLHRSLCCGCQPFGQASLMTRFTGWLNQPRHDPIQLQPARKGRVEGRVERPVAAAARAHR